MVRAEVVSDYSGLRRGETLLLFDGYNPIRGMWFALREGEAGKDAADRVGEFVPNSVVRILGRCVYTKLKVSVLHNRRHCRMLNYSMIYPGAAASPS